MRTTEISPVLAMLFAELAGGASQKGGAFILNSGDIGLLRSLEQLSAASASRSVNDGATIAAHAQHVRYGLSLMNRWAREGGGATGVRFLAWTAVPPAGSVTAWLLGPRS